MKVIVLIAVTLALCLLALKLKFPPRPSSTQLAQKSAQQLPYPHFPYPRLAPEQPPEQVWCDKAHKVPFVPADQCGGMTSCDRLTFNTLGGKPDDPIACTK